MQQHEFSELREIVYAQSGIRIADGKEAMVLARLNQRLRALQLADVGAYLGHLKSDLDGEIVALLDVISTNVTGFYREPEHFEILARALDERLAGGARRVRVWCAASSTGEEPYTLAMTVREAIRRAGVDADARILATDISTRVLEQAERGEFAAGKVQPIPGDLRRRYFRERKEPGGVRYRAEDGLRGMLRFRRLNLSKPPFPLRGPLDAVFCRNVMIYFDTPVRRALVDEFLRLLRPGGLLVVGKSESLIGLADGLDRVGPSVYRSRC
jgi:chemotaxis protein methyltransferase CheR